MKAKTVVWLLLLAGAGVILHHPGIVPGVEQVIDISANDKFLGWEVHKFRKLGTCLILIAMLLVAIVPPVRRDVENKKQHIPGWSPSRR